LLPSSEISADDTPEVVSEDKPEKEYDPLAIVLVEPFSGATNLLMGFSVSTLTCRE
jgi:hypothetical protein